MKFGSFVQTRRVRKERLGLRQRSRGGDAFEQRFQMHVGLAVQVRLIERKDGLRPERTAHQNLASVEFLGEALENETRFGPAVVRFPKTGRAAAIDAIVAVVERNDAETCRTEDLSPEYPAAAADEEIESEAFDRVDVLVGKSISQARFREARPHANRLSDDLVERKRREMIAMNGAAFQQHPLGADDQREERSPENVVCAPNAQRRRDLLQAARALRIRRVDDQMRDLEIGLCRSPACKVIDVLARTLGIDQEADLERAGSGPGAANGR